MTDYCTLADVKAQIPESGLVSSTDYDTLIESFITVSSRLIDRYLGVPDNFFYPSTDAVVRYYDGTNSYNIKIDPFLSVSELAVSEEGELASTDYTVVSSTDYYFKPYNAAANGRPYHTIEVDALNTTAEYFPAYQKAARVTGIFGYSTTPPALIAQAAKTQTLHLWMQAKQAFQKQGGGDVMQTPTTPELSSVVKMLLMPFVLEFQE